MQDIQKLLFCYDLIFVCGLYKTGTSLITEFIENKLGFINPSAVTNNYERAYGKMVDRYYTRECKILRALNSELINSEIVEDNKMEDYLLNLDLPSILKDPQFCLTLNYWYPLAIKIGYNPLIIFTSRNHEEIEISWKFAPYTRKLINNGQFNLFYNAFEKQKAIAKTEHYHHINLDFFDIIKLSPN